MKLKTADEHRMMMEVVNETVSFAGKMYPKFGNVVLLVGGGGSGKGFAFNNVIGIEGKKFDVDELKRLSLKTTKLKNLIQKEIGKDPKDIDLKNPEDVGAMHLAIAELGVDSKSKQSFYSSVYLSHPDRKPNIIYDITLKNLDKLYDITKALDDMGYDKEKIHICWVIDSIENAIAKNKKRSRVVPEEILANTHHGVSMTMLEIAKMGDKLKKYLDGDIHFIFNQKDIDVTGKKKHSGYWKNKNGVVGYREYFQPGKHFKIKSAGKPVDLSTLDQKHLDKLNSYTSKLTDWK